MAREAEALRTRQAEIAADIETIRREALGGSAGAVIGAAQEQIAALDAEHAAITERLATLQEYTQGHEVERFLRIHAYSAAAQRDGVIEIPTVATTVEEGLDNLRHGQPFLLAGHLGSGKTMMAMYIAKLYMMEHGVDCDLKIETDLKAAYKEPEIDEVYDRSRPEFFAGSEETSIYDLVGKMGLVNGETKFRCGPLGRALRDDRPIVIDEINLIPAAVLGRINQDLLRGVGSIIRLQENGEEEVTVGSGFAILATCNLGAQYAGTQEVNAAFASRWVAKEVQYPSVEEMYDLMLAALVRKDRVRLPPSFPPEAFEQLADLAITTHEIQGAFSGRTDAQRFMAMAHGVTPERAQLEQTVISPRDLMRKILGVWKERDFSESLDTVIARNILASTVFSADDQKFMTELFIRRGFFRGWTAEQFSNAGILSVAQKEIDALQAAMGTDEYKAANADSEALRTAAHASASLIRDELLLGTRKPRSGSEDIAAAA